MKCVNTYNRRTATTDKVRNVPRLIGLSSNKNLGNKLHKSLRGGTLIASIQRV